MGGTLSRESGPVNVQLTVVQLWALVAGGPIAMVLTVLVGILINNSTTKATIAGLKSEIGRVEGTLRSELQRLEGTLRPDLQRVEGTLRSELQRVEGTLKAELQHVAGVIGAKLDALAVRVNALEDDVHSPLVKQ